MSSTKTEGRSTITPRHIDAKHTDGLMTDIPKEKRNKPAYCSVGKSSRVGWLSRLWHFLTSIIKNKRREKRLKRIADLREMIQETIEFDCPSNSCQDALDYSFYDRFFDSDKIQEHIDAGSIISDKKDHTCVDKSYISYLLEDISCGPSKLHCQSHKIPKIIGIWSDDMVDTWGKTPKRLDTEDQYFSTYIHSMLSYIDDTWNEDERLLVWKYLRDNRKKVDIKVIVGGSWDQSHDCIKYGLCTDDKYIWHESLEDFVLLYNVRPPDFFVEHILKKIEDQATEELNNK